MSEQKVFRKFRQINRVAGHDYMAKEIRYVEVEPGWVKSVILFDDGTSKDGPTVAEKFFKMNMDGFDVPFKARDGSQQKSRYTGMTESKCFEEIVEPTTPTEEKKSTR